MKKILFAGLGALTALFCCCNKPAPTPPEPTLELSTTQVNCPATLYSQMVEVTTNVSDWSATFKQTAPTGWSLAKKGSQLTISVSANTELEPITATVVVKASEGISKEIIVNQLGQAPAILLSQKTAILDNGYPRELAVEITTNIEPQVKIEGNWLTLKEPKASKAMVAKSYRFAVAQNGQEPRTGKIIFVKAGGETPSDTMLVFQPAFADTLLLYKATEMNISYGVGGKSFNSKQTDLLSKMEQGTIIVQQLSSIADKQTLVGLADDRQGTAYFTLYIDGKNIGFETHGVTHIRGEAATTRPVAKLQTIALKATKGQGYKLFANGRLLLSLPLTGSNYQFLSNIEGLNSAAVGKLPRASGNDIFPYSGQMKMVEIYDSLLSDERLLEITNQTPAPKEFAPVARFDMFYKGDATRCNQFRIPSLLSLSDGTVLASMDARFGGTFDSPNNLDNALRRSTDGGRSFGEATLPLNFTDFPNTSGYRTWSASFIDPVMMEDKINRRVYMMVDAFPWGGGIATAGRCLPGSGFKTIGTEKYLALTSDPVPEDKQTADQDMANFNFTIRQGGIIWDDRSNQPTEYSVNNHFELLHKGIPLTVKQQLYESVDAPMSIYFERSLFRVFRTSYLWIIHSDDSGATWSAPINVNYLKQQSEQYFIAGPGNSIQIQQGTHRGRLLLPVYFPVNGRESCAVIYSDDQGATWQRGETPALGSGVSKMSEAQVVELPGGAIAIFARNAWKGKISYAISNDGGTTFGTAVATELQNAGNNGCQISVINLSQPIEGKAAVAISFSDFADARKNGTIALGLINQSNGQFTFDWKYKKLVSPGPYGYSCLTELPGGNLGLLFEGSDEQKIEFMEIEIPSLME